MRDLSVSMMLSVVEGVVVLIRATSWITRYMLLMLMMMMMLLLVAYGGVAGCWIRSLNKILS